MIGKLILTILVAMTINMSADKPVETNFWESDETASETISAEADLGDAASDLLFNLAIEGADWVGAATSETEIQEALTEITLYEDLEIQYAYYGSAEGAFYIYPSMELPEDYDFRERPPYLNTMAEEIYYAEPYTDAITNRQIQTIGITVYDENGIIGVLGIDAYID
ncbi:PDC sensor domain-containing protein [Fusibacter sp. 3D3]|uniref:PDC sensor domain-containing protein n=1 Tax=Fusibacter sp. 3D3 TaxID=1048380 RepID=UPI00085396CD|nr:PDC sensor domain-containing protein [Fusibacter sp. 3D3]GAU79140.1 methyl-accepting chemotaxis protein [Fusibacter sp. 3D3]